MPLHGHGLQTQTFVAPFQQIIPINHSARRKELSMNSIRIWIWSVRERLALSLYLIDSRDGKAAFMSLLWRNLITWTLLLVYALTPQVLVLYWLFRGEVFTSLHWFLGALAIITIVHSLSISLFNLPDYAREKQHLDGALRQLNPVRLFIHIPFHRIRNALLKRRLS